MASFDHETPSVLLARVTEHVRLTQDKSVESKLCADSIFHPYIDGKK